MMSNQESGLSRVFCGTYLTIKHKFVAYLWLIYNIIKTYFPFHWKNMEKFCYGVQKRNTLQYLIVTF